MTATTTRYISPRDRLIVELTKEATQLPLADLKYIVTQAELLNRMRMEQQAASSTIYDPETEPYGA